MENLLAIEMRKTNVKTNKLLCLDISVLDISRIAMYKYWYDYEKPNCGENAKLYNMDMVNFIVHVKS